MSDIPKQILAYGFASGCALIVDVSILWSLVYFLDWGYLEAAALSFAVGTIVAYKLSVKLAFKRGKLHDKRLEFLIFAAIGSLGFVVNATVIFVLVERFDMDYLLAKSVAVGFTFACNFWTRRQILFVRRSSG